MSKRPTMTLADVRRAIAAQNQKIADAHDDVVASGRRSLPVTSAQLYRLSEACDVRVPAGLPTTEPLAWMALRC